MSFLTPNTDPPYPWDAPVIDGVAVYRPRDPASPLGSLYPEGTEFGWIGRRPPSYVAPGTQPPVYSPSYTKGPGGIYRDRHSQPQTAPSPPTRAEVRSHTPPMTVEVVRQRRPLCRPPRPPPPPPPLCPPVPYDDCDYDCLRIVDRVCPPPVICDEFTCVVPGPAARCPPRDLRVPRGPPPVHPVCGCCGRCSCMDEPPPPSRPPQGPVRPKAPAPGPSRPPKAAARPAVKAAPRR